MNNPSRDFETEARSAAAARLDTSVSSEWLLLVADKLATLKLLEQALDSPAVPLKKEVYSHRSCIFKYCPTPEVCRDEHHGGCMHEITANEVKGG